MMKRYRVSNELKKYVRRVLILSHAKWRMMKDEDGQVWCITNLTSNHFHKLVQRAKCEKATEETGTLYITFEESCNEAFVTYFLHMRGKSSFAIIDDPYMIRTFTRMYGEDAEIVQELKRRREKDVAEKGINN